MKNFCFKFLTLLLTILGIILLIHSLMYLMPGDPATVIAGEYASPQDIEKIRQEMSLDRSYSYRYWQTVKNVFSFNFGESIYSHQKVSTLIFSRLGTTFTLAFFAMLIASCVGVSLGLIAGINAGNKIDTGIMAVSSLFVSTPIFVSCLLLILIFSYFLHLLPPSGVKGNSLRYFILPALALGSRSISLIIRITRNQFLEIIEKNYIKMVRSLGFSQAKIILCFVFKNILVPIITVVLLDFGAYLGGAIVTESVFSLPGVGRLLIVALQKRDFPLVQGIILFSSLVFILIGFFLDQLQNHIKIDETKIS